ncbi:hypothetical protein EVG20_g10600, partial [Dentipellis fragilis]
MVYIKFTHPSNDTLPLLPLSLSALLPLPWLKGQTMTRYNIPYIPLTVNGRPSPPPSERTTRARWWSWIHVALVVGGLSNIILGWLWWHNRSQTGFPPLDDYQILKDDFDLVAPASSTPNSTAIVSSIYNDIYLLPVLTLGHSISKHYANNASTSST